MSRRSHWHYESRFVVEPTTVEVMRGFCSPSGKFTWVTSTERLRIHTLRGVPGSQVDVLLPDETPEGIYVCEIGLKTGSYDHNKRWRIAIRTWPRENITEKNPSGKYPSRGSIFVEEEGDHLILIAKWFPGGIWAQSFRQLQYTPAPGDRQGILLHHWKNWFKFLPEEDVRQTAAMWNALPHTQNATDIVVLNRTASAALYDLAISLGWRKLTVREKRRLGLADDSQQWHRADGLLLTRAAEKELTPTGCGQHTLDAARGKEAIRMPKGICPDCHELQKECECK